MNPPPALDDPRQTVVDGEHLKLLRIFHFVVGGLRVAFASLFLIHTVLFFVLGSGVIPFEPSHGEAPPLWIFRLLAGFFGLFVALGWTSGILTIVSGCRIGQRRARTFSIVIAALNCLSVPFGTLLGVFTLIVLNRATVRRLYDPAGSG